MYVADVFYKHRRLRDPLNNVGFVFNKAVERLKTNRSNPSLQLALYDHVHPDLSVSYKFSAFYGHVHCGQSVSYN